MQRLEETYCGTIAVEYMHIQDPAQKLWIQERIESQYNRTDFTERGRYAIYERLTADEMLEKFLNLKYTGPKRFCLDGGQSMGPALEPFLQGRGHIWPQQLVSGSDPPLPQTIGGGR